MLVRLIKTLYLRQQEQAAKGKKLYKNDEKVMKEAEKMLLLNWKIHSIIYCNISSSTL